LVYCGYSRSQRTAADEPRLHDELVKIKQTLPDVQSIWIFASEGHPQAISRESPPPNLFYGDNDYLASARCQVRESSLTDIDLVS
jgi:hypothetical protein